jgi:hypothetical protein
LSFELLCLVFGLRQPVLLRLCLAQVDEIAQSLLSLAIMLNLNHAVSGARLFYIPRPPR